MVSVAHGAAVQDVGQAVALDGQLLGVVVRGIGAMQPHLGIVAQVLQQLSEVVVLVGDGFVVHVVVAHQREELEADAGVLQMGVDDELKGVEGVGLSFGEHTEAFPHLAAFVVDKDIFADAYQGTQHPLAAVTVGRINVDGVFVIKTGCGIGEVGIAFRNLLHQQQGPSVNHRHVEEPVLEGAALGGGKTAVGVGIVWQVFLVARQAEKSRRKQVEREVAGGIVGGVQGCHAVVVYTFDFLLFDGGLEHQFRRTDEETVAHLVGRITEFGTDVLYKGVVVGRNLVVCL